MKQDDCNFMLDETFKQYKDKGYLGMFEGVTITKEEFEKIVDKWNNIGCTSFQFKSEEIKEILERGKQKVLSVRNNALAYISGAFLNENIEDTCSCLEQCGIQTKNTDGTYKTFNEVMQQIYRLHIHE